MAEAREIEKSVANVKKLTDEELDELFDRAMKTVPGRLKYYTPRIGVTCKRITIHNQRTKWGSCSGLGNLNINCMLMLAPPEVLDSIIVHELCHLKKMDHSDEFYAEVLKVYPDYWKWHNWLKENGAAILARMP